MKKQIYTLAFALCVSLGYSQNSDPWPTNGYVGIGTWTPNYILDVVDTHSLAPTSIPVNVSFHGNRIQNGRLAVSSGLLTQVYSHGSIATRLQSVVANSDRAYMDFNAIATRNTGTSAVLFGIKNTELMRINVDGKVRISSNSDLGTPDGYKLFVEDGILTEKVKVAVKTTSNWADYVFAEDYKLMPLNEVEKFTKENKHLPNVPSAKEMTINGLDVAQMDSKLMEKVEELTLYLIEQNKQIELLKAEVENLKKKN